MDVPSLVITLLIIFIVFLISCRRGRKVNLPPGPSQFPIVGNLFQLTGTFHRTLSKLAQRYGPLMTLRLLNRTIVVVSSPEIARELFRRYDRTFIQTEVFDSARALDHHKFSLLFLPAMRKWRNLRKLSKEHLFSSERLNASKGLREEKVQQLCDYVHECCSSRGGQAVNIGAVSFSAVLNFLSNTFFSVDFVQYSDDGSDQELQQVVHGLTGSIGKLNLSDFFPALQRIDPQGIRAQTKCYLERLLQTFDGIFSQRTREATSTTCKIKNDDLLEALLQKSQGDEADLSHNDIKHLFLDLFIAGTHTTSATIEWAMAELLKNPEKMTKVVAEIKEAMGDHRKLIQESDISMLPYLQAVVKEALRLHPPVCITGRIPSTDIQIDQYLVPKDAQLFINLWAINRDPRTWSDPDSFVPERFLDRNIDMKGQHFELLPFGVGRRVCPGLPLAHRMVHLVLAYLLHNFDWTLADGIKPEDMDMSDKSGFLASMKMPLKAIPSKFSP